MAVGGGLNVRGPTDSMRVDGGLTVGFAVPSSPGTSGTRDGGEATVSARIEGTLALPRALDVRAIADSIPLRLMRFPSAVDSVRGVACAELRATGQLDDLALSGSLALRDGGLRVRPIDVVVSGLAGVARLANDTLVLDSIHGRANGGQVSLTGTVSLAPDRTVDARLAAAGVRLAGDDASARILGFAEAHVHGPLDGPRALAEARLLGIGTAGPVDTATIAIGRAAATLAEGGALDARFTADSLPLRILPAPAAIRDVRGRARGELRVSGTLDRPRLDGAVRLEDAALRVVRTGTLID
jgi:autotransporter translocation and assembly factor TamB